MSKQATKKQQANVLTWANIQVRLGDLDPWDRNPRSSTEKQVAKINESFEEFGQVQPIAVGPELEVYDGHQRLTALMQSHGPDYVIDARQSSRPLTEKERERLVLLLHAGATGSFDWDQLATWDAETLLAGGIDEEFLKHLNRETRDASKALSDAGVISGGEVGSGVDAEPQIDRAEELRAKWGVETGQVWRLGEHRLMCGDSTSKEDVERLMEGERVTLVFTDPPYGVAIGAKNRMLNEFQRSGRNLKDIEDDALSPDDLKSKLLPSFVNIKSMVMSEECTVFVTAPQIAELNLMLMMMMREAGLPVRHVLIWKKNQPTFSMGRLDYDYQHEPILLTWGKRHKRPMKGPYRTSIWEVAKPRASADHPTMKPVELVENALLNNSDAGDLVFDAYCGSGTTIMACESQGRKARCMEISPGYVGVILERWSTATGKQPELVG